MALSEIELACQEYERYYLKSDDLAVYLGALQKLDGSINSFFVNYGKLDRSSFLCASLWTAVMHARTQLVNAVTHISDKEQHITIDYAQYRKEELHNILFPLRFWITRALQYVVIFNKHNDEEWRFLRQKFLQVHARDVQTQIDSLCYDWSVLLLKVYEVGPVTTTAYSLHLQRQYDMSRRALIEIEQKVRKRPNAKFEKEFKKVMKQLGKMDGSNKDDKVLLRARILLNTYRDMDGVKLVGPEWEFNYDSYGNEVGDMKDLLLKFYDMKVLDDDEEIWPHQQGVDTLGPFKRSTLANAATFIEVSIDGENVKYQIRDEVKQLISGFSIGAMTQIDLIGKGTILCETNLPVEAKRKLDIPEQTAYYSWFFPIGESTNESMQRLAAEDSPLHALFCYGGYAYFDRNQNILQVNAVLPGEDMFFDGPYMLKNKTLFDTEINGEVTLKPLTDKGAEYFTWVHDIEKLQQDKKTGDGSDWNFYGCFCYKYSEEDKQNYFQLINSQDVGFLADKDNNTPTLVFLRTLWEKYGKHEKTHAVTELTNGW
mmetsp:Transcript_6178/g.7105  ORF Transcript_6178/g.7105 Transcript_6178/m.7105 type:complete len:542 (+) Transcript_6178:147-1772(+)